jgi:hypothetical protein
MFKTDPRRLVCTQCKHENEIERVYCHNCGEKLDRSLLPQIDESKAADDKAKSGRQVKKMMNPNRFAWARTVKTFILIILFAALVAAVFLAVQAPDNVPSAKSDRMPEKMVREEWAGMMAARVGTSEIFTAFDINYYLHKTLKGAEGALGTKFERAFAHFEPGLVTLSTQRNLYGLVLYNSASFKPVLKNEAWSADIDRIAIGRLIIPASLAKLTKLDTVVLGAFSGVFEKEMRQLDRVAAIESGESVITFTTKPAK